MNQEYSTFISSSFYEKSDFIEGFSEKIRDTHNWNKLAIRFKSWENSRHQIANPIPKIIHQIWLGKPLPSAYFKWTLSWKKKNPEWKYILWNEESIKRFGLANERIFRQSPSYGVKSDIARYEILYRMGGVYADTDFECLSSFDELVTSVSFFAGTIFSHSPDIANGLIGSVPGHPLLGELIKQFHSPIRTKDGMEILAASGPNFFSNFIYSHWDLLTETDVVFPSSYFYPFPNFEMDKVNIDEAKNKYARPWSLAIHYWEASWLKPSSLRLFLSRQKKKLKRIIDLCVKC